MRMAMQGNFHLAVALILLAAVLDGIDGRIARLLGSESALGAELDSLADFVNFGVAPGFLLYLWGMQDARGPGWIAVLVFAICCVLRLARFNIGNRALEKPEGATGFVGVPAPAGALVALLPLYLGQLLGGTGRLPAGAVAVWMVLVGLAMISRVPTPSLKSARIYAENAPFVLVGFVILIAALATYPWATLTALSLAYVAVFARAWHRARREGP
jgi:CDP-diacylglycerol--serine O-phosphatidyltransferase